LFGGSPEGLSQRLCRADIQIDPDVEDPVELAGLADLEFDGDPPAGPLCIGRGRVDTVELEDTTAAGFKGWNRIAEFLRERDPVGERTRKLSAHMPIVEAAYPRHNQVLKMRLTPF